MEEWKEITGFRGYEVSSLGHVRSWRVRRWRDKRAKTPRTLAITTSHKGYLRVMVQGNEGQGHWLSVHRAVALAFIGEPPSPLHEVGHVNHDKRDNRPSNVAWVTRQENIAQRDEAGRGAWGERVNTAKLTPEQVRMIRLRGAAGERSSDIAHAFGVSAIHAERIINGVAWKRLKEVG
jgi:hypothetical protein